MENQDKNFIVQNGLLKTTMQNVKIIHFIVFVLMSIALEFRTQAACKQEEDEYARIVILRTETVIRYEKVEYRWTKAHELTRKILETSYKKPKADKVLSEEEESEAIAEGRLEGEHWIKREEEAFYYTPDLDNTTDFSGVFHDVNLTTNGTKSNDLAFGCPVYLVVKNMSGLFLVEVNNVYGCFVIWHANEKGKNRWESEENEESREIIDPVLYERLIKNGLKILSDSEIKQRLESLPEAGTDKCTMYDLLIMCALRRFFSAH